MKIQDLEMPDQQGYFGEYGGQLIPPQLKSVMDEINAAYDQICK
ncbi:MAG TPA: tryptophan synthase subunit beta, partial [Bdellovibrionota bacterium]|nr:tryptophan synthase subunit beta [Bdellovibrionota bacterium]